MYDLCVVGGGMSGMTAAITAARNGKKVILIEKNKKLGKKLYATGNGRCNITNMNIDLVRDYNSANKGYVSFLNESIQGVEISSAVIDFYQSIGVATLKTEDGYVYPASFQASSVVWALIDALKELNVEIMLDSEVRNIIHNKPESYFNIEYGNEVVKAKIVVLANGSKAYSKLGGSDSGYKLAKKFKHTIVPVRPSLCGLVTLEDLTCMSGVRAKASVTLYDESIGEPVATQSGELQITDYGLSGIMIFNISSIVGKMLEEGNKPIIHLDFVKHIEEQFKLTDYNLVDKLIQSIIDSSLERTILGFLNAFVNDKLANYICKILGINTKTMVKDISEKEIEKLINALRDFKVNITEIKDFDNGQVCAGGVDISEINPKDYSSKLCDGLYIVGELLDIDGLCGGFNLTFAVLSGIAAGKAI